MDFNNIIQNVLIYALPVLFAITVHEAAHGYVARYFGDNTAYSLGRITLNPLKHIDPIGTIAMPMLMFLTTIAIPGGPFVLGYAKPVPVRFGNLKNPKRDMVWVAAAGPIVNFLQAIAWGVLFVVLGSTTSPENFFFKMSIAGIGVNLSMAVFNLFPLPPLDGGRVAVGLLPWKYGHLIAQLEPYGFFIVIALITLKILDKVWMIPGVTLSWELVQIILLPLKWIFQT
jgi:Zn-dependent protease